MAYEVENRVIPKAFWITSLSANDLLCYTILWRYVNDNPENVTILGPIDTATILHQ
jgi:hypothetical protein